VLDLAERAVALQPAAEAVIQVCRRHRSPAAAPTEEGLRVADAYLALRGQLRFLAVDHPIGLVLATLLDQHLQLVRLALDAMGPAGLAGEGAERRAPDGLGQAAGRLVGVRDLLRRTVPVSGRRVADLPVEGRL
jgi:hypothetical protein